MAAGSTYTPIATTTLGSAQSSYTFTSIPQTYTDLVLISSAKVTSGTYDLTCRLNGDTGANYSWTNLLGNGSGAGSTRYSGYTYAQLDNWGYIDTTIFNVNIANFMNYANSTTYKTILARASNAGTGTDANVDLWRDTSAITSIQVLSNGGTFTAGCTFTLYGIAAA